MCPAPAHRLTVLKIYYPVIYDSCSIVSDNSYIYFH